MKWRLNLILLTVLSIRLHLGFADTFNGSIEAVGTSLLFLFMVVIILVEFITDMLKKRKK